MTSKKKGRSLAVLLLALMLVGLLPAAAFAEEAGGYPITVTKTWADNNDEAGKRPASIDVQLLDTEKVVVSTATLTAEGGWTGTLGSQAGLHRLYDSGSDGTRGLYI